MSLPEHVQPVVIRTDYRKIPDLEIDPLNYDPLNIHKYLEEKARALGIDFLSYEQLSVAQPGDKLQIVFFDQVPNTGLWGNSCFVQEEGENIKCQLCTPFGTETYPHLPPFWLKKADPFFTGCLIKRQNDNGLWVVENTCWTKGAKPYVSPSVNLIFPDCQVKHSSECPE